MTYSRLFGPLVVSEAESLSRHVRDQGFTETNARLNIDLIVFHIDWISGVDNVSVLSRDNLLDKDSHEDLVDTNSKLLGCQEGSLVELACPDPFDRVPSLIELGGRDSKLDELLFEISVVRVRFDEFQSKDELLALVKHLGHLLDTLDRMNLCNKGREFLFSGWL